MNHCREATEGTSSASLPLKKMLERRDSGSLQFARSEEINDDVFPPLSRYLGLDSPLIEGLHWINSRDPEGVVVAAIVSIVASRSPEKFVDQSNRIGPLCSSWFPIDFTCYPSKVHYLLFIRPAFSTSLDHRTDDIFLTPLQIRGRHSYYFGKFFIFPSVLILFILQFKSEYCI